MQVEIRTRHGEADTQVREWLRRRLDYALGRFGDRIRRATLRLEDLNGPRGGLDQRCVVEVRLHDGTGLMTEVVDEQMETAAGAALDRMARRIRDELARRRDIRRGHRASAYPAA